MLKIVAGILVLAGVPLAATTTADVNTLNLILNVATVVGVIGAALIWGPRAFKAKQAQADLLEKDRTIATRGQALEAARERIESLEQDKKYERGKQHELEERNRKMSEIAAGFQARYEEQSKYTAKEAFGTLELMLTTMEKSAEQRHKETLRILSALGEVIGERRQQNMPPLPPT